jgi:hypothetical protein
MLSDMTYPNPGDTLHLSPNVACGRVVANAAAPSASASARCLRGTFHLAGGSGGIEHFFNQFAAPMEEWWQTLGQPHLTDKVREAIMAGVATEIAGRSIDELAAERDRRLVEILALKGHIEPSSLGAGGR